jgi:hypothetical protein
MPEVMDELMLLKRSMSVKDAENVGEHDIEAIGAPEARLSCSW